ncbi:MAG: hypothetical protein CVV22_00755 [Ignavibacteriae bacterium HGW-Ignavibacteriae-1]|jgi:DNA replication ATP-dependent helicase Dna2|nr:MAG: hypothetical protein CVV22_00755 [Ignavibacteriae bacterium HGW-Ignavibacteriae-1]
MIQPDKYLELINSIGEDGKSNHAKRLKKLVSILKSYYRDIADLANQSFPSSYAINSYIHERFKFPPNLKNYFNKLNIISKNAHNHEITDVTVNNCIVLVNDIINYIYTNELIDFDNTDYGKYFNSFIYKKSAIVDLMDLLIVKIIKKHDDYCIIEFLDEDEKISITFNKPWNDIYKYMSKGCHINAIDVNRLSDNKFETAARSIIVLEPDYLVDVTEIANSFQSSGPDYYVNFIKKISDFPNSIHLQIGKIVNTIFDEIIQEPNADFDSLFEIALKQDPLSFFDFFENNKNEFGILKEQIRKIINNLSEILPRIEYVDPIVEPSFISPTYGLQGRLDIAEIKSEDYTEVNILELKSGKPPSKKLTMLGDDGKYIQSGVWAQHLAQVTGYNLLIDEINKERFGVSAILYAQDLDNPIRNVPNTFHYKRLIISHRNYIVGAEFALAARRFKLIDSNSELTENITNYITSDLLSRFYAFYNIASPVLREWFREQISFVYREIITGKTGFYGADSFMSYSNLWKLNKFDLNYSSNVLTDMKLNLQLSNPQQLHLYFEVDKRSMQYTSLRQGDIVVLFHSDSNGECLPHKDQLLRGSIISTGIDFLIISLRNKTLPRNSLNINIEWAITSDRLESTNKSNLNSIFKLLSSDKKVTDFILGLREPEFDDKQVDKISYLNSKQNEVYTKCINAKNYFIIQGPPGTGKTSYMLRALVDYFANVEQKTVLVLAYTNRAVDEIESVISSIEPDIKFLRLGSKASKKKSNRLVGDLADKISLKELYKEVVDSNVYISTVASALSNDSIFGLKSFDIIITDEASQIPEFQLAGLLTRAKKFILIGDEKQLPAIISQSPQYYHIENELLADICMTNLSISLFDRLLRVCKMNEWVKAFDTLIFQARMHEDIQNFPNMLFYNNALQIFGLNQKEKIKHFSANSNNPIERILATKRFIFINCMHGLGFKESEIEAKMVLDICQTIKQAVKHHFNNETIGVIAPYRVQCSLVKSYLTEEFGDTVNVDTVERYQGSQREFIIMSSATNYEQLLTSMSNISYFDDIPIDRKLNVAMTRAKSHFIFIGNAKILQNSPIYAKLLDELRNEQAYFESSDLM